MAHQLQYLGSVTITSGQQTSSVLRSKLGFGGAIDLLIYTPAALTGTCSPQVAGNDSETTNFLTVSINGGDVVLPANRAVSLLTTSFGAFRVSSSIAEGADRVFAVYGTVVV